MKQRTSQSVLPPGPIGPTGVDVAGEDAAVTQRRTLLGELRALFPPERLIVESENLFVYECDAQTTDRGTPLAIVFPEATAEVSAVVKACARRQVAFVPRGAGTGLSGGAVATGSVVISLVRMNQIQEIDAANRQAWVGPGV